jgi:hypothetical protein
MAATAVTQLPQQVPDKHSPQCWAQVHTLCLPCNQALLYDHYDEATCYKHVSYVVTIA